MYIFLSGSWREKYFAVVRIAVLIRDDNECFTVQKEIPIMH